MDTLPIATQWPQFPYRGLDFYREADAPLFRERDKDIEESAAILLGFGVDLTSPRFQRVREVVVSARRTNPAFEPERAPKFLPQRERQRHPMHARSLTGNCSVPGRHVGE